MSNPLHWHGEGASTRGLTKPALLTRHTSCVRYFRNAFRHAARCSFQRARASCSGAYFSERGLLTAGEAQKPPHRRCIRSGNRELTFLGNALERFSGALNPVLAVVSVGRKQADHFVGSARGRTRDIAGSKIDGLSNPVLMCQRPSPLRKFVSFCVCPRCFG
jgi:hypothetical protein